LTCRPPSWVNKLNMFWLVTWWCALYYQIFGKRLASSTYQWISRRCIRMPTTHISAVLPMPNVFQIFDSTKHIIMIYVICVCLLIVVSNPYYVVFLFCFSSYCVPYVANFSGLSIFFISPSVFSNVYLLRLWFIVDTFREQIVC
jgi:hypothetical protein